MKTITSFVALGLLASALPAQQLVLPDFQYLCESTNQLNQTGSTAWWRSGTGSRFQILYEASHFTGKAGVDSPITINKLMFRGESGEPNLGGQSWAGVAVSMGVTSLTAAGPAIPLPGAALTTTFATNLAPGVGNATLMVPAVVFPVVTVEPSVGSTPNNYNIVLDLAALSAAYSYDPTGLLPNLLIDITLPAAPTLTLTSGNVMAIEDTTGAPVLVRGRGVSANNPAALTGALANPPVVGIEFSPSGSGGYNPPVPARNEFYGAACGGEPISFYQSFLNGQPFDLAGCSLILTPKPSAAAPAYYEITKGVAAINYLAVVGAPSTADDALVPHVLPWTFLYPGGGGGTTTIQASTNGFIWLDPAMSAPDPSPSVPELLGTVGVSTSRLAPFWYDFHCGRNLTTSSLSGLYVSNTAFPVGFRKCYVTWFNVGVFNSVGTSASGHAVHDMQCVIDEATGVVEFHYGAGSLMPQYCSNTTTSNPSNPGIVGFSVGKLNAPTGSMDPRSRDLSHEIPFRTYPELTGNIGLTATASMDPGGIAYAGRAFGGQTLTWHASGIPAPQMLGIWVFGLTSIRPGLLFSSMIAPTLPECMLSIMPDVMMVGTFPTAGTDVSPPLSIPHGWEGIDFYVQYVSFAPFWYASNALKHTIGLD